MFDCHKLTLSFLASFLDVYHMAAGVDGHHHWHCQENQRKLLRGASADHSFVMFHGEKTVGFSFSI